MINNRNGKQILRCTNIEVCSGREELQNQFMYNLTVSICARFGEDKVKHNGRLTYEKKKKRKEKKRSKLDILSIVEVGFVKTHLEGTIYRRTKYDVFQFREWNIKKSSMNKLYMFLNERCNW